MKTLLAITCAAGLATATAAAQQSGSQQTPSTSGQQSQQTQPAAPAQSTTAQTVTMTGCVVQASDEPAVFAIRSTEQGGSSSESARASSSAGADQSDAIASRGGDQEAATGTAGAAAAAEGAWYRLTAAAQQNLQQYTGQRVEVNGRVTPGRDEKGADVVIHRIEPEKTVVTAIDLKPAPQLAITSIKPLGGSCPTGQGTQSDPDNPPGEPDRVPRLGSGQNQ